MVEAHDRAVQRTLAWFEKNVAETRMTDPETGFMTRAGGQKTVVATFRHDTSRNLDPALHTHAVIANMVKGGDGKWRSMSNEKLYESKMLLGALYRGELAAGLGRLGYGIDKTHADGRFEIAGVSREVIEAFSTPARRDRGGDRIRWTRNDAGLGLVNSQTAEVAAVRGGRVTFRLEGGRMLDLQPGDAQLRHIDRAWASTVHAFQGRTVDTVIAAMEANHPHLTTQKTLYVEISRARDKAELVTDDKAALRRQLEEATGERIAALEAVEPEKAKGHELGLDSGRSSGDEGGASVSKESGRTSGPAMEQDRAPKSVERDFGL